MSASSKWLPLSMIVLGTALLIAAITLPWLLKTEPETTSAPVPPRLGDLSLVNVTTGNAALWEFTQLHGKSLPVRSGAKANYGAGNQATLWIAGTATSADALQLLESMRDKIASDTSVAGKSPFQPADNRQVGGRTIYALDGMGQKHFYFQSGEYLIWLAANPEMADQALQQALIFYP